MRKKINTALLIPFSKIYNQNWSATDWDWFTGQMNKDENSHWIFTDEERESIRISRETVRNMAEASRRSLEESQIPIDCNQNEQAYYDYSSDNDDETYVLHENVPGETLDDDDDISSISDDGSTTILHTICQNANTDKELAENLLKMINPERATNIENLMTIAQILRDIDISLLQPFKLFCEKSIISEEDCENIWNQCDEPIDNKYTIETLCHFAKIDNPTVWRQT